MFMTKNSYTAVELYTSRGIVGWYSKRHATWLSHTRTVVRES